MRDFTIKSHHLTSLARSLHVASASGLPTAKSAFAYTCDVETEPIHRYKPGGYHPTHLGDHFKDGRYRIVHKLGWGGYSTVWAAKDREHGRYVALKISIAEHQKRRELDVMKTISGNSLSHTGSSSLGKLLDQFEVVDGPNGTHGCVVLELLGPSLADVLENMFPDHRFPAKLVKTIARQVISGVDYLHQRGIGHGDLHTRNIAFTIPELVSNGEDELLRVLGKTELGEVKRADCKPLELSVPAYLVQPSSYALVMNSLPESVKLVDYGEAFFDTDPPVRLHTPLAVRAPEVLLGDKFDHRADLWSLGCLIFELFTGQPPFDVLMQTPGRLLGQMKESASDELPERWVERAKSLKGSSHVSNGEDEEVQTLQQWLEEVYFDEDKTVELSRDDIRKLGDLVGSLLYFEPSSRATAASLLRNPWLKCNG